MMGSYITLLAQRYNRNEAVTGAQIDDVVPES
jgi:hypothetical protein